MFIGITGPLCSGKHTVAKYLVEKHNFTYLSLTNSTHPSVDYDCVRFNTLKEMQIHVTERWLENFVTCDVDGRGLWLFKKRPFFLLVSIEAPISVRFQRHVQRSQQIGEKELSLLEFVIQNDLALFNIPEDDSTMLITDPMSPSRPRKQLSTAQSHTPLYTLMSLSDVTVANAYQTVSQLHACLDDLDLTNHERLRPSWDTYFMHLSDLAARRSNCMKRRVGCILVRDSRVIATGYNGTPKGLRNCNEGGCQRCNDATPCGTGLDRCLCMHAEENALLEAGRERVGPGKGVILYCNTCPCLGCAIKIVQTGVKEVVFSKSYGMDDFIAKVFAEAGVKLRQHSPPSMRLEMQVDVTEVDSGIIGKMGWMNSDLMRRRGSQDQNNHNS
ncbi:unnamed protein product [Umbelopsis ramanniana]